MPLRFRRAILGPLLAACAAHGQSPVPQPPINLGLASFMDAEGGLGILVQSQNTAYKATRTPDAAGDRVPGHFRQEVETTLLHVAYTTPCKLAGGYVGFEALVPFTNVDVDAPGLDASRFGVGELILGVFLQWSDLRVGGDRREWWLLRGGAAPGVDACCGEPQRGHARAQSWPTPVPSQYEAPDAHRGRRTAPEHDQDSAGGGPGGYRRRVDVGR